MHSVKNNTAIFVLNLILGKVISINLGLDSDIVPLEVKQLWKMYNIQLTLNYIEL